MAKTFFIKSFLTWYRRLIRHSKYRWLVLLGTLAYVATPIDLIPSFIPVIGWLDDGLVVTLALTEVTQMLLERRRRQASLTNPEPKTSSMDSTQDDAVTAAVSAIDVDAVALN